ncbi:MAG: discoidin domain-containing protein, partial [Nanoarchaeota archaeon]|nr:discoidin domain-containing protein [Nanoarchaeota archaeon]
SNQWADGKNPTSDADVSANNRIHHNYFNTQGNECVDIKEGSVNNTVEYNICTGQKDPNSAGLDSRSDENVFRHNTVFGNDGAGVRLGGHLVNGIQYGKNNDVYNNTLYSNKAGGVKFQTTPQGKICGNTMHDNAAGNSAGTYRSQFDPAGSCGESVGQEEAVIENDSLENVEVVNDSINTTVPIISLPASEELKISQVTASSHDGNVPQNTLDNDVETRWSAKGKGQWITYKLPETKKVKEIMISFHRGDSRIQYFKVFTSLDGKKWTKAYSGKSNGDTNAAQTFNLRDANSQYVKIVGDGTSENSWNSLTEVKILGS